jgi:ERCC4-type nuclease
LEDAKRRRAVVNNPYSSSKKHKPAAPGVVTSTATATASTSATPSVAVATTITSRELAWSEYCAPKLRDTTKQYPDLRPNLVLAMWKFARTKLVRDSYQGKRLDQFAGRIVDLTITAHDFPIRSVGEYGVRKRGHISKPGCGGIGNMNHKDDTLRRFEEELNCMRPRIMDTKLSPMLGKYFSISEACLVAMKETIQRRWIQKNQGAMAQIIFPEDEGGQTKLFLHKHYLVSLVELIPLIDSKLRPECPSTLRIKGDSDHGASHYLHHSTRSAEFKQLEKLLSPVETLKADGSVETTSYLKKRSVGGKRHYQLTPLGFQKAVVIYRRALPAPAGPYRTSNLFDSVLPKYHPINLAVDFREGGAGDRYRRVLHLMCNKLDLQKIPYFVNTLRIGDYCFFSGDKLCPILVERKSVEDVAKSIDAGEGRWVQQKHKMYQGQYVFGYQNCRIAYIIEGNVEKHLVSNDFVGNAIHKVSKAKFEEEVATLEEEGFEVLRTCSVENSMFQLSRWAESVTKDVRSGKLPLKFTYDEFLKEVDKIPKQTDFSRLARYHAHERKQKSNEMQAVAALSLASATVDLISDGESNDGGHRGDLRPIVLDEKLRRTEKNRSALDDSTDYRSNVGAGARKRFRLDDSKRKEARRMSFEGAGPPVADVAVAAAVEARGSRMTVNPVNIDGSETNETKNEYAKWTAAALREKCVELGLKKVGSKKEVIERLLDLSNRPPPVYRLRQQRGLYVPANPDTSATAILVAIQIVQDGVPVGAEKYRGATKDEIYVMAEKIDIKKDPFCGGTTQTGPYREFFKKCRLQKE